MNSPFSALKYNIFCVVLASILVVMCILPHCRMNELATPIIRDTMDHVQFNPEAFNVSESAKKAKASPRIEELAQPIRRGT